MGTSTGPSKLEILVTRETKVFLRYVDATAGRRKIGIPAEIVRDYNMVDGQEVCLVFDGKGDVHIETAWKFSDKFLGIEHYAKPLLLSPAMIRKRGNSHYLIFPDSLWSKIRLEPRDPVILKPDGETSIELLLKTR